MKFNYLFVALALILFSCNSDDETIVPVVNPGSENLILVANEGGFMGNSASLTLVDHDVKIATQNIYSSANDDAELGDIAQSIYQYNNEIYVVVNNSGKIEVIDDNNFTSKRTITGLASPRYMLFESSDKAYVSDISAGGIHIVNPSNGTYTSFINTPYSIEHMVDYNDEIWCSATGNDKVYFVNSTTDMVSDSLELTYGVNEIVQDKNNDFWILSRGDAYGNPVIDAALHKVDGDSKTVLASYTLPLSPGYGEAMAISGNKENVLIIMDGKIFKMGINDSALPAFPFIEKTSSFYSLSVNSANGEIGATDAFDYSQSGKVYFFSANGNDIDNYSAGIVPRGVLWLKD